MILSTNIYKKLTKLLKLKKPLVIFDIETTGRAVSKDKIIEIAYIKIWPNGMVKQSEVRVDPEIRISPESTAVHGIRNREVKGLPKFRDKSQELWETFHNCYYSGFNIMDFDLPVLRREFIRVGMDFDYDVKDIIDTREIYKYMVPRTIGRAYEYYCKKQFKHGHSPKLHAEGCAEILLKELEKYKAVGDWEFINIIHESEEGELRDSTHKFYWLRGEAYFNFSKYKDQSLTEVAKKDPYFLQWILEADFSNEVKNIVKACLERAIKKKK